MGADQSQPPVAQDVNEGKMAGRSQPSVAQDVDLDALIVQVEGLDLEENRIGSGAYGVVIEVSVKGRKCIAKKLHNILVQADIQAEREFIVEKFRKECRILSGLNHPNVVSFVGVHYGRDKNDISLIMERLHTDLAAFVAKNPSTTISYRIHILHDVSCGLDYLHGLHLLHRDLTAPNVLLTEDLTAKIGDLGVSRYVNPSYARVLTTNPGNLLYMPPECRVENPTYSTQLDIFSFGNLIIHTVNGKLPDVFDIPRNDPNEGRYKREGKMELMRRNKAVHKQMGENHCLYPLVVHCLHDEPDQRPTASELIVTLRELCRRYPRETFLEACKNGHVELVQVLLEGGADPNQADENNKTALHWASKNGHDEVVRVLIQAKANVNIQDKFGQTPLYMASFDGHQRVVELLIQAGANVDVQKETGFTALIVAARNSHCGVVRMLLEANADVYIKTNSGQSPLWTASFHGHQKVVELLIKAGANVDVQKEDGFTALIVAAHNGHCGVVRMLLEANADVNIKDNANQTALHMASNNGHDEVVRVLLAAKATVNTQIKWGESPLWTASFGGHQKVVELLVKAGANVDVQRETGFSALHMACQNGHFKVAETLILARANINIQNKVNVTPLMSAAYEGHASIVQLLLSKGADPNLKNIDGDTAYGLAQKKGHTQVCQQLYSSHWQ